MDASNLYASHRQTPACWSNPAIFWDCSLFWIQSNEHILIVADNSDCFHEQDAPFAPLLLIKIDPGIPFFHNLHSNRFAQW